MKGEKHGYRGSRPPTFEEWIRRPGGAEGVESVQEGGRRRPSRDGTPEAGACDSRVVIEAGFLAGFGFCFCSACHLEFGGPQWCIRLLNGFASPAKRRSSRGSRARSHFTHSTAARPRLLLLLSA